MSVSYRKDTKMGKKTLFCLIILFLVSLTLFSSCAKDNYGFFVSKLAPSDVARPTVHIINPDSEVRGVWIASVFNIDYPSKTDLSADELKAEIDDILDTCAENGLNTVFFQVRPSCDALYKSDIFPISKVLSSDGKLTFDPLEYIVAEGHRRNIFIHAWVNPLRITLNSHDIDSLSEDSPARKNPDWTVAYDDGKLYFNPGIPEVRELVCDGIREIVTRYDVDGIVFDDYFYPYPVYDNSGAIAEFGDADEFLRYGQDFSDIADWRRDNINKLVKSVYETVHSIDPDCDFGVSPFGVWQNDDGTNGGSESKNLEAYNSLYCDALAWINGGYIDYISPQIYWKSDDSTSSFDIITKWWNAQLDGTDVKLYVSHAAYRYEDGNWENPSGELASQISFARSEKAYRGSISYGYDEIKRNINGAGDDIKAAYKDEIIYTDIQSNGKGVEVISPASGTVTSAGSTYLVGSADPYYPLTMNGKKVSQTKSGYFNVYTSLSEGENKFVFSQNGIEYVYTVTKKTGGNTAENMNADPVTISLSVTETYPKSNVITDEDILWVSCTAPYGSTVEAEIGGVITRLSPLEAPKVTYSANGYIAVSYGANAALPVAPDGEVLDCGNIKYTVSVDTESASSEGSPVRIMGNGAKLAVTAISDYTELKISESSLYYNDYTIQSKGMCDYIVSQRGGYYKLRMGGYVKETSVEETDLFPADKIKIEQVTVSSSVNSTLIRLKCKDNPVYNGCIDETGRFVVTFYNIDAKSAPEAVIEPNPLIKSAETVRLDDKVRYSFELYDILNFYGFDLYYEDGYTVVTLKNPISIDLNSDFPLTGIKVHLDAGHGGNDPGALGAMSGSATYNEKDVNLAIVLKAAEYLLSLGADVTLTRESDETVELMSRARYLEENNPDLFISIHQNSMDYSNDPRAVHGTLALWCMDAGRLLSATVGEEVSRALCRNYEGDRYQMLAACRNPKFPSALIEVGYMTSVEEYEQITKSSEIEKAAWGIADGVLRYFEKQAGFIKLSGEKSNVADGEKTNEKDALSDVQNLP